MGSPNQRGEEAERLCRLVTAQKNRAPGGFVCQKTAKGVVGLARVGLPQASVKSMGAFEQTDIEKEKNRRSQINMKQAVGSCLKKGEKIRTWRPNQG